MAKQKKLNSMRFLEKHKIPYDVIEYPDTLKDAEEIAETIGFPAEQVYKTLVVEPATGGKPCLVMIASDRRLDLKQAARASGQKKVQMASHADAEAKTGLKVGGISALALTHKNWDVYLDQPAGSLEKIVISAGQRGMQLVVPVRDLVRAIKASLVEVSTPK